MGLSFDTNREMIEYFNNMAAGADYDLLLQEDFGVTAPENASEVQKKYYWRYLTQGQMKGLQSAALFEYAQAGVRKFFTNFPWVIEIAEREATEAQVVAEEVVGEVPDDYVAGGRGRPRKNFPKEGEIIYNEVYKRFYGYGKDYKMVASSNDLDKLKDKMKAKYGYVDARLIN